jgi:hypothetical protein
MDGSLAVKGITERVDNSADESFAGGNGNNSSRSLNDAALGDTYVGAEKYAADKGLFKVERHTVRAVREFEKLVSLTFIESVNLGYTVTYRDNVADLVLTSLLLVVTDLLFYNFADIIYF